MKHISFLAAFGMLLFVSCSPKTGEQSKPSPTPAAAATGSGPNIPIPTGNVRKAAPQPGAAPKIQIGKAATVTLDNGLTLIVVENHKLPTVSFRLFVDYDPVMEKENIGYVEMLGDLMAKGTKTRTKAQIDQEIDFIGASLNANPNGVSGSCLTKHADKFLAVMSDVALNPTFPQEELDKSKKRAESGLAQAKNDPNAIAGNVTSIVRYGKGHPYGEIMTEATLAKVNVEQIKNHYNTYFKPNIAYLVVVGDITKEKAEKYAKQYFGKWQKGIVPEHQYGIPRMPEKTMVEFVHKPGAVQSVINITYPVELMPNDPDVIKARVMNTVLGGYFNSRVNANLREGHGWTYGARTSLSSDELVGAFTAAASVRNAVTDSTITEFMKELNRMRTEKVPVAELQVVKNVLTGQFSQSLEEPGTAANFALNTARYKLPADYYEKYLEVLQNVTPDDVMNMARRFIRPDRAHVVVVGNKDDVAERLKQFSADGKVAFLDAFGNPVKMNNATMPEGMTAEKVLEDYLNAIGGGAKIAELKEIESTMELALGGPVLLVKSYQKGNTKVLTEMSMNGQVMSKRIFDGQKAQESGMGGAQRELEGEDLGDIKEQAYLCKESRYKADGYKLNLKGLEEINGSNAYVVEVLRPDGKKTTEYYDMKTSLKVREWSTSVGPDGSSVEVQTDFADYKAINGVMFPHTITITGPMPRPMKGTMKEIKVNTGIDDVIFKL